MLFPITFDPSWDIFDHWMLAEVGHDSPECFRFPDIFADGIDERQRLSWAFSCREILRLPIDGAYREIVLEMSRQLEIVGRFRQRMKVLTCREASSASSS